MIYYYIVRHGQTLFNQKDRVQGWCDSPLTELGMKQAQAVGIGLKDINFIQAYTSISERAYDTALSIIQNRSIPLSVDKRLKEFNFGYLEGEANSELMKGRKGNFEEILKTGWVDVGGENEMQVQKRIYEFFNEINAKYQKGNILLTSHGLFINTLLKTLDNEGYLAHQQEMGLENCSVSIISYDGQNYRIVEMNNVTYRDEGLKMLEKISK